MPECLLRRECISTDGDGGWWEISYARHSFASSHVMVGRAVGGKGVESYVLFSLSFFLSLSLCVGSSPFFLILCFKAAIYVRLGALKVYLLLAGPLVVYDMFFV